MSRTIRRTGDKKRNKSGKSNFVENYTTTYDETWMPDAPFGWRCAPRVEMQGKEFDKAFHKFHGDTKPNYGWSHHWYTRYRFEQRCRMENKQRIIKYLKDPEYVVVPFQPGCLSWED